MILVFVSCRANYFLTFQNGIDWSECISLSDFKKLEFTDVLV